MNELIFLAHILLVVAFVLIGLRMGRNFLLVAAVLQALFANLFVVKQTSLFGLSVTCSDVFSIGGILALNLLQEYFGKEAAKAAMRISFFGLVFFACMSQIHLLYAPTALDGTHSSFLTIFSQSPRIILASIAVFYGVQKIDIFLFGKLRVFFEKLPVRIGISLLFSQVLDTVLFSFLGLYGLVESLFDIIVMSLLIKGLIIGLSSLFIGFSKRFVKVAA